MLQMQADNENQLDPHRPHQPMYGEPGFLSYPFMPSAPKDAGLDFGAPQYFQPHPQPPVLHPLVQQSMI